ncbi:hypothetical protein [Kutzneria sp. CA-103260]|uniref:hypothetical protein n=1 Tax=Kutzneria sp. CA-103260 TaxID=2802641 RepID=UPI001BA4DC6C|nr:hypothetical protein [Kutzneria sp. CA-103260]QUQ66190.1 hypothetical protein JJ691_39160 [Kutzneria sp. CA-103260]
MVLRVTRVVEARTGDVEGDVYVPFSVDWVPVGSAGTPAYYFAEDRDGGSSAGYVELKIERVTGEVIAVVVVNLPKRQAAMPDLTGIPVVEGGVRVDLAPWEPNPDLVPTKERFDERCPLSVAEDETHVYFGLSDTAPVRLVMAGPTGFGIGPDDELTGIVVARTPGVWESIPQ